MTDWARGKYKFDGYITSDCGAVGGQSNRCGAFFLTYEQMSKTRSKCSRLARTETNYNYNYSHYTNDTVQTVNAVLSAGMDIDCGSFMSSKALLPAIQNGSVAKSLIDTALKRLFMVQFRLGWVDPKDMVPWTNATTALVDTPAHRQLALEAAQQGLVLLKNQKNTLPLKGTPTLAGRSGDWLRALTSEQ